MQNQKKQRLPHKPPFPAKIPPKLAEKINPDDPLDPIALQFTPSPFEQHHADSYTDDPLNEQQFFITSRLIQKYRGRALLITTNTCPMHCRYCFRKFFACHKNTNKTFTEEIDYITQDNTLSEIILSGGEPLSLPNNAINSLLTSLVNIPHINRIRFHTRFPIGYPERLDDELITILNNCKTQLVFVIHTNHPNELDHATFSALNKLQRIGIPILSQTVLLKNINDNTTSLANLFLALASHGIIPYYLHQLDPVAGSAHFHVPISTGKALIESLSPLIPGYAIPRYVQELPHKPSKIEVYIP